MEYIGDRLLMAISMVGDWVKSYTRVASKRFVVKSNTSLVVEDDVNPSLVQPEPTGCHNLVPVKDSRLSYDGGGFTTEFYMENYPTD